MEKLQKIFREIFYILLIAPVLFLLVNKWPYLLIGSVLISILMGLVFFVKKRVITSFHSELLIILGMIYIYFIKLFCLGSAPFKFSVF
jgi:hypothetical protein